MIKVYLILTLILLTGPAAAETLTVMHRAPASSTDKRQDYNIALIHLALDKTRKEDETIELLAIPPVSSERARALLSRNKFPNLILELTYEDNMKELSSLDYAAFPVELGALSYRTCFESPKSFNSHQTIKSRVDLLSRHYATGVGWPESYIFPDNQFSTVEVSEYENFFKMLHSNRFDYFCRGTNEILNEYMVFNDTYQLHHEKTFLLHYQLPRFFFVHKSNHELKSRLEKGLQLAFEDGSLLALWKQHFSESVRFSALKNRTLYELENTHLKHINHDYELYLLALDAYY